MRMVRVNVSEAESRVQFLRCVNGCGVHVVKKDKGGGGFVKHSERKEKEREG